MKEDFIKEEFQDHIDPISYYNSNKLDDAINLFNSHHRRDNNGLTLFIKDGRTQNNEVTIKNGLFIIKHHSRLKLPKNTTLTPFQVYFILSAGKNIIQAIMDIQTTFMGRDVPFIRVGTDYYKVIFKPERHFEREELKRWTKSELVTDYGKGILNIVKKFDDFVLEPDNETYSPVIKTQKGLFKNLYAPFEHESVEGDWSTTKMFLTHIFGDQYDHGIKYLQCLYLLPKQILPILVLASEERSTGKTTFINYMSFIFGANMNIINPNDLTSDFNGMYSRMNIIAIEETFIDKSTSIEKLKAITTAKYISVNQKHIDNYKIPFYGKIIITTNKTKNFARIDKEEIRFWVREIGNIEKTNANIEDILVKEIPAFLHHLKSLPEIDNSKSRMVFTPEELYNDQLEVVKQESKPTLFKEICENIIDHFDKNKCDVIEMTLKDIKDIWFAHDHSYSKSYIKTILSDHFNLQPPSNKKYFKINSTGPEKNTGRAYTFRKEIFENIKWDEFGDLKDELPF